MVVCYLEKPPDYITSGKLTMTHITYILRKEASATGQISFLSYPIGAGFTVWSLLVFKM